MSETIKESKRMELICEFLKTGKQPDGYKITETKTGKYRLSRIKPEKEVLEAKRIRLQKNLEDINAKLEKLNAENDDKPNEESDE